MRSLIFAVCAIAGAGVGLAQQPWELGAGVGVGFSKSLNVKNGSASADTGLKPGVAFSFFGLHSLYEHFGGEIRYTLEIDNLKLKSGGTEVTRTARSHAVHYDMLFLTGGREAKTRLFLSVGGGVKAYVAGGPEPLTQPLSDFALLTKTRDVKPLMTVGGGLRLRVRHLGALYLEVRDYITPPPDKVIAPRTELGARLGGGWVHNIIPMVSVSYAF